jgi:ligand-binding sensor protein
MNAIDIAAAIVVGAAVAVFIICGLLASRHVDPERKKYVGRYVQTDGEAVDEIVLTPEGMKWARARNTALVVIGATIIPFAIYKALIGDWH